LFLLETLYVLIPLFFFSLHPIFFLFYSCSIFGWYIISVSPILSVQFPIPISPSSFYLRYFFYNAFPFSACYSNCGNLLWSIFIDKVECISSVIFWIILVQCSRIYYISSSALEFFRLKTLSMIRKRKITLHPYYNMFL
jgi:hypothetical protein